MLIHNAGALDDIRQTSPQRIELTVASQVVGPFLLTELLLPALRAGAPARVLWVSSGGMYSEPLSVDHLEMSAGDYNGTTAYPRAKRAQVTLAELWSKLLAADRIFCARHAPWLGNSRVRAALPCWAEAPIENWSSFTGSKASWCLVHQAVKAVGRE